MKTSTFVLTALLSTLASAGLTTRQDRWADVGLVEPNTNTNIWRLPIDGQITQIQGLVAEAIFIDGTTNVACQAYNGQKLPVGSPAVGPNGRQGLPRGFVGYIQCSEA